MFEEAVICTRLGRGSFYSALWGQDLALYRLVQGEMVLVKL